jgi:hypothetical protein
MLLTTLGASNALGSVRPQPHTQHRVSKHRPRHHTSKRRKIAHAAGWAGAGAAASHLAGPAGSAAVGAAKYRHDLKKNWRTRRRAMVKIGAPIAAGAAAGPVGTAGYEGFEHRRWLKRHLTPTKHDRSHPVRPVRHRVGR